MTEHLTTCPRCESAVEPHQDWCLACGGGLRTRVAAGRGWKMAILATGVIVLLSSTAVGIAALKPATKPQTGVKMVAAAPAQPPGTGVPPATPTTTVPPAVPSPSSSVP